MGDLEARQVELTAKLTAMTDEEPVLLHPSLAQVYGKKIQKLAENLNDEATKPHAMELLRGLALEVRLHPDETASGNHSIELYGELAAILALSPPRNDEPSRVTGRVSVSMVAGVGFEPTTFRL